MNISIIITTYNKPQMLEKIIRALIHQKMQPLDVVIADDGSTMDTKKCVEKYIGKTPFDLLHVWHKDKGFQAAAIRNRAILKTRGDYIISLDGDCIPDAHFVADHRRLAQSDCFFQGKRVLIKKDLSTSFRHESFDTFFKKLLLFFSPSIKNRHHLLRLIGFPAQYTTKLAGIRSCNLGFFRESIWQVNGFNQDFVGWGREDSELAVRLYRLGLKRKEHPFAAICYHLWHPDNSRQALSKNDELLKKTMESHEYYCINGLVQKN